ncbi:Beta-galactosidase C-terminal domain [Microbacterium sp. QXD-8]|uniref:Beta-galactosidase C-terminal domain n=1 Tax=Microbacterium psychrotolerans TaxID=3068321 RepID=A0ABU0Z315_9MICO|nr:Beta-galactosidase C-terminal domain [Microbacterium sp. QXD-8]MDQ7878982.1 Beta-galactosidase C-terminal domain [Microbacterium sp. QXD-8]
MPDLRPRPLSHLVTRALERHDLVGPYADVPGLELATRIAADGQAVDFLLHHGPRDATIRLHSDGTDLLTGRELDAGDVIVLHPTDVIVIRRMQPSRG